MTTEEKAKAYDEVLKTATQWFKDGCSDKEVKICLESIFPQLRESEDERIRKEIIDFIQWAEDRGMTRHDYHQAKRPAIWIAYLEKQKENPNSFTDGVIEVRSFQRGMEEGRRLEKQKECVVDNNKTSAEEDERIRARLIEYFKGFLEGYEDCYKDGGCVKWEGLDVKSILAWLEKQKDHFRDATKKVEQKPAQTVEEKEYVRTLKGLVSDFIRDSGGGITDIEYYQNICDWLDGRHIEQKPAEYIPDSVKFSEGYKTGREVGFREGVESVKPAEWSEVDLGHRLWILECLADGKRKAPEFAEQYQAAFDWLKSLPERFNPQPKQEQNDYITPHKEFFKFIYDRLIYVHKENPDVDYMRSFKERLNNLSFGEKQEWSEEDEENFKWFDKFFRAESVVSGGKDIPQDKYLWFKSLRPQPQGTYKQVIHTIFGMLKDKDFYEIQPSHRVSLLNDIRVKCKDAIECAPILDEPSWKPSEAQLMALHSVIDDESDTIGNEQLKLLYGQLKKLM